MEYMSIAWMFAEVLGSFVAGLLASSFALIAFGSDSVIELASAFIVLRHLRLDDAGSRGQGERTALLTSLLLIGIVPVIGITSTYSFFVLRVRPEASVLGLAVAIGAVAIMPILWLEKRKIGLETGCLPLSIDAIESETCFLMSLALLAGLALEFVFHTGWFDYAATVVILAFVAFEGRESFEEAMKWRSKNLASVLGRDDLST
jgi:divalent metal cation (Fe/Co/Zn/Cd) transporter